MPNRISCSGSYIRITRWIFAVSFANLRNLFSSSMSPIWADIIGNWAKETDVTMWGWVWKENQASAPRRPLNWNCSRGMIFSLGYILWILLIFKGLNCGYSSQGRKKCNRFMACTTWVPQKVSWSWYSTKSNLKEYNNICRYSRKQLELSPWDSLAFLGP